MAHLGDFLANFIYTSVRVGHFGIKGSIHVWDNSLKEAMELAELRAILGKKTKPDKVADAAEALIAYCYFTNLMELPDMVAYLKDYLELEHFSSTKREKIACGEAFSQLFRRIMDLAAEDGRFT
ncbi:MAG: ribonuclease III family protein [Candidatus Kariarchaeaceae archaeon]